MKEIELLAETRRMLLGEDADGRKKFPSMFDDNVISFAHGDGIAGPPKAVILATILSLFTRNKDSLDRYRFQASHELLTDALIKYYKSVGFDHTLSPLNVCTGPGITGLFQSIIHSMNLSGSHLFIGPGYYHAIVGWANAASLKFRALKGNSFCKIDPEELEKEIKLSGAKKPLLFLINPNYVGQIYERRELQEILDVMTKYNGIIIEDIIFCRDVYSGATWNSIGKVCRSLENVIVIDSASKSFGIANLRIGWVLSNQVFINRIRRFLSTVLPGMPYISENSAWAAFTFGKSYLDQCKKELQLRQNIIINGISEINSHYESKGLSQRILIPYQSQAAHSLIIEFQEFRVNRHSEHLSIDLSRTILNKVGVAVSPGISHGLYDGKVRLSFGSSTNYENSNSLTRNSDIINFLLDYSSKMAIEQPNDFDIISKFHNQKSSEIADLQFELKSRREQIKEGLNRFRDL